MCAASRKPRGKKRGGGEGETFFLKWRGQRCGPYYVGTQEAIQEESRWTEAKVHLPAKNHLNNRKRGAGPLIPKSADYQIKSSKRDGKLRENLLTSSSAK